MPRHRSTSGKYITEPIRGAEEILRFGRLEESGCILPPEELPFGYWKQKVWYVQVADRTAIKGRTKKSAIQEIFRFYYPFNSTRLVQSHKIQRICKTQGCLNYRHYEIVNGNGRTSGEIYMANEQIVNLLTTVLTQDEMITFGDASAAESFRMHIYRLKRKWKKEGSPYHAMFEDVVIKKDKLHTNMLNFTTHGRSFDDVLARFNTTPMGTIEEPMSVEEKEYLDDVITGKDHGKEVLQDLGYTPDHTTLPKVAIDTTPTYDACYAKACAGGELTKQEQTILQGGPEHEGL